MLTGLLWGRRPSPCCSQSAHHMASVLVPAESKGEERETVAPLFSRLRKLRRRNQDTWYLCLFPIILAAEYCKGGILGLLIYSKCVSSSH